MYGKYDFERGKGNTPCRKRWKSDIDALARFDENYLVIQRAKGQPGRMWGEREVTEAISGFDRNKLRAVEYWGEGPPWYCEGE